MRNRFTSCVAAKDGTQLIKEQSGGREWESASALGRMLNVEMPGCLILGRRSYQLLEPES